MSGAGAGSVLLHDFLIHGARETPDAPALIEPRRRATYRELDQLSNRFAQVLRARGVAPDDRVVLALDNGIELVACYFGALKAGAVAVPLPAGPRSDRLAAAIADCTPAASVVDVPTATDPTLARALEIVPHRFVHRAPGRRPVPVPGADLDEVLAGAPDAAPDVRRNDTDLAAIIYTSGSTGAPRGVMLTHLNFRTNAASIVQYLGLTRSDRVMCVLPFNYVYGLSLLHTHLSVGGSVVIDQRFVFPNVVLASMREHGVTGFAGVPSTFALLLHKSNLQEFECPTLRYVTQAGGGMPPARIEEWLNRGPAVPFWVMYGATEASARLTALEPGELRRKLGSIGKAIPNVEIAIVKEGGARAATGEVGELVARGANISRGYWNHPEETARKFDDLGYRTGDLGYRDEEGFLFLVGRLDDMIKVGAHRVGAKEIEDVLNECAGVSEAAVVPQGHAILGEVPVAFVAGNATAPLQESELQAHCVQRLASHKVPAHFYIRPELPKLAMGKIDRQALRREANSQGS
jgi:amino acid adenylation domain-containing protein